MSREEIQKLLGGYATGTLTPEEQQALFAAALEDQDLFDELAREQPLRDLLRDPAARVRILAALDTPAPARWYARWWRPLSAAAAAIALASVTIVAVRRHKPPQPVVTVAKVEQPVAPAPAAVAAPVARKTSPSNWPVVVPVKKPAPVEMARVVPPAAPVAAPKRAVEIKATATPAVQTVQVTAAAAALLPEPMAKATDRALFAAGSGQGNTVSIASPVTIDGSLASATNLFSGGARGGSVSGGGGGGVAGGVVGGVQPALQKADGMVGPPLAGHLGIQYRILQRTASGDFVEGDLSAGDSVAAGEPFKLQITANDSGYLRVVEDLPDGTWRAVVNRAVTRMVPIETPPVDTGQAAPVTFEVVLSREPIPDSIKVAADSDVAVERARAVTVAARSASARLLSVFITVAIR